MTLTLTPRAGDCTPIDLRGVTPEALREKKLARICRVGVRCGNRDATLGDLFTVAGDPRGMRWRLVGDWSCVHSVGAGMAVGEIVADSHVGRHAAAGMRGGELSVGGDSGDWLAVGMTAGLVRVGGNAGDHAGGALPGSRRGMGGGTLLVQGNAGDWLGERMRRGLIAVAGNAGLGLAAGMLAGTILIWGRCTGSPGVGMRRGTLGLFGPRPALAPTFLGGAPTALPMWSLLQGELAKHGFAAVIPAAEALPMAHGDTLHGARGEVVTATRSMRDRQ